MPIFKNYVLIGREKNRKIIIFTLDSYTYDMLQHTLDTLEMITLCPESCRLMLSNQLSTFEKTTLILGYCFWSSKITKFFQRSIEFESTKINIICKISINESIHTEYHTLVLISSLVTALR